MTQNGWCSNLPSQGPVRNTSSSAIHYPCMKCCIKKANSRIEAVKDVLRKRDYRQLSTEDLFKLIDEVKG